MPHTGLVMVLFKINQFRIVASQNNREHKEKFEIIDEGKGLRDYSKYLREFIK